MYTSYFKIADSNDMTHGDLSKSIHFLKCEEGGCQEMCEVSERIYREGIEEGKAKGRAEGRALIVILLCQNDLVAWHLSILLYRFLKEYNRIVYIVKVLTKTSHT